MLHLDESLVKEARKVGKHKTDTEAIMAALQEYIARRQTVSAQAAQLQEWVDQIYGPDKPTDVVDALIAERRQEAAQEATQT